jgi:hypothetical protein
MILCLSLGVNTQAAQAKSITNKPKDIKSIKVGKVANSIDSRGLRDITLDEFFKKVNNKKEEELIKKIVVGTDPDNMLIVKEKDTELYSLMLSKSVNPSDMFSDVTIFFNYDFRKGKLRKSLTLGNYYELLDSLDKNDSKNLSKNVVDYIDNKEISSKILPYSMNCYNLIANKADDFVTDKALKNSKNYYSEYQMATDNKSYIGVDFHTTMGKIEYFILISKS